MKDATPGPFNKDGVFKRNRELTAIQDDEEDEGGTFFGGPRPIIPKATKEMME